MLERVVRYRWWTPVIVAATLIVAGCGDSERETGDPGPAATPGPQVSDTTDDAPTEATEPASSPGTRAAETMTSAPTIPATSVLPSTDGTVAEVAGYTPAVFPESVVVATGPAPPDMCPDDELPQAAAYDVTTGGLRWVSCTATRSWRTIIGATGDAIFLRAAFPDTTITALDVSSGADVQPAPAPPPSAPPGEPDQASAIDVDGITISGSQEGPITASDSTGTQLWSQPGRWVYSDVWAIGGGAVFGVEMTGTGPRLAAYDVPTGAVRWSYEGDPYGEGLWPWYADDDVVVTLWSNAQVRATSDGQLLFATAYPPAPGITMSGAHHDGTTLYVSFATEASAGD